jgi:hypothetical protein
MDRAEALVVLHEILEVCKESVTMNSVSIDTSQLSILSKGYEIKINCDFRSISKQCVEPILEKHKLIMKELKGLVVIKSNTC